MIIDLGTPIGAPC